jgi:hypothetical protein
MLAENSQPQAPTYLRNIQTGKSKKKSLIHREGPCREEKSRSQPLFIKEHREGKGRKADEPNLLRGSGELH